ncbi:hypothetical protein D3C81_2203600 [compost metagenome]
MFGAATEACEIQRNGQFQPQEHLERFSSDGALLFGSLIPYLIGGRLGVHVA